MSSPRILILTASVGAGHNRAAEAVELALHETCPAAVLQYVDVLELANPAFRRLYARSYFDVLSHAPHLIGYLYDRLDQPLGRLERGLDTLRFGLQNLNVRALSNLLTGQKWDLAINTHFLPAEVIGKLRQAGKIGFPQMTVTTDFDTHRLWCNPPCEHYFTATEEGRANLMAWGVDAECITASGIPVHPLFAQRRDARECRRGLHLMNDRPVVLQMAGGLGIGPIERIHEELLGLPFPVQLVVVAGRNVAARTAVEAIPCPCRHRRTIFGFTDQMDELMGAADVIVSKPGGLTASEALCCGTPMVIVDPIPGQETRNSDYLLENGAAVKVNNLASLRHKIAMVLSEPGRLEAMRAAALRLGRPRAAFDVARRALELLHPIRRRLAAAPVAHSRRFWRTRQPLLARSR